MPRKSEIMRCNIQGVFSNTILKLQELWDEVGLSDSQITQRGETVLQHVNVLFERMITEETSLKERFVKQISTLKPAIESLRSQLQLESFTFESTGGLMQQAKLLQAHHDDLCKNKNERLEVLQSLKAIENKYCEQISATPLYIDSGAIPSKQFLNSLREHIETLKSERTRRLDIISSQISEIINYFDELGLSPDSTIAKSVFEDCAEEFLTDRKMSEVEQLLEEMEFRKNEARIIVERLKANICELWERLETNAADRNFVEEKFPGIKQKDIDGLEQVLADLQALKLQSIQQIIEKIRLEIQDYWKKCYYSYEQKERFVAAYDKNYNEDLLTKHEEEVEKLKNFYNKHKNMFKNVDRWQNMFARMVELEDAAKVPNLNRYNNRGGNLLVEERERKQISTKLPKIQNELFSSIEKWETELNEPFLIEGVRFTDYVQSQWDSYDEKKELEKQERMLKKMKETEMEVTFGSNRKTPLKQLPKTPTAGNLTTASRRATMTGTPLTPINRSNFTPRYSPGKPPISTRLRAGPSINLVKKFQCEPKKRLQKNEKKGPVAKKAALMDTISSKSSQGSTKSAPNRFGEPGSSLSCTVVSDEPSARTAPVFEDHIHRYDDFAADIENKLGSKILRSSAIGEKR